MCCNCNCNNGKHGGYSSEEKRLQAVYHELEKKNPGSILTGKGMYDRMKAQQAREERRNQWRR